MYATPWFHTLFSHDSQLEFVQRLWDIFFNEGYCIIFRLAVAIIKEAKDLLFTLEMTEIVEFLKIVPKQIINPELILQAAFKVPKSYLMVKVYTPEELSGKDPKKYIKQQYDGVYGGIYHLEQPKRIGHRKHKSEQRKILKPVSPGILKTPRGKNSSENTDSSELDKSSIPFDHFPKLEKSSSTKRAHTPLTKQAHVISFKEHFPNYPNFQPISEKAEKPTTNNNS